MNNLMPGQIDELTVSIGVFFLIAYMCLIVRDMVIKGGMNRFAAGVVCLVLLGAPFAYMAKNIAVLFFTLSGVDV